MLKWTNDGFEIRGFRFVMEFGAGIATARADYPAFITMKSRDLIDAYMRVLFRDGKKFDNVLELGIMKGGSCAFFNLLLSPQNHMAVDVYKHESGLDRFADQVSRSGRKLLTRYDVSQADTGVILNAFGKLSSSAPKFDLVIDDASHNFALSLKSFNGLFPHVKEDGLYVLEDWGWAHWNGAWQQPSHEEYANPALSNIVLLASLCCTASPGVISRIEVTPVATFIYRGPTPLADDFSLEKTFPARNRTLSLI